MENDNRDANLVKQIMANIYAAFEELDAEKLDRHFSHSGELLAFGTDWDEKFVGWDQYKDIHRVQLAALKSFKFTTRELEVHVKKTIAWASDRPHWEIETKEGERVENNVRITAVLKKEEDEQWRVVQWHVSVGLGTRLHEY